MSASLLATKDRLHKRGRKVTNPFPNKQIQLMHPYKIDPLILSCTIYIKGKEVTTLKYYRDDDDSNETTKNLR